MPCPYRSSNSSNVCTSEPPSPAQKRRDNCISQTTFNQSVLASRGRRIHTASKLVLETLFLERGLGEALFARGTGFAREPTNYLAKTSASPTERERRQLSRTVAEKKSADHAAQSASHQPRATRPRQGAGLTSGVSACIGRQAGGRRRRRGRRRDLPPRWAPASAHSLARAASGARSPPRWWSGLRAVEFFCYCFLSGGALMRRNGVG